LGLLTAYAEGLSGADAAAIATANANWDKAAEHAARCAPYLHHRLAPVDRPVMRKLSEMTNEELEAAAQVAREELAKMRGEDGALAQDARSNAVALIGIRTRDDQTHRVRS
jgi:hypothetical protein